MAGAGDSTGGPSRPRVLVLTQYFDPEPTAIITDVVRRAAADFDVVVVTAHPNFPAGRFYPGTRWWTPRRTSEQGVTVWRLPVYPDHGTSKSKRFLNYASFAVLATALAPIVAGRPQVVWVYQTPFTVAVAARWFKAIGGAKLVYAYADLWPESFVAAGMLKPGRLLDACYGYRRLVNGWADVIISATRGTVAAMEQDAPQARHLFIPVWAPGVPDPLPSVTEGEGDGAEIVYVGSIGPPQGLEVVIRAAALLERDGVPVRFKLYGSGPSIDPLRALADELGVATVTFPGPVPPDEAFAISARARGQIVVLKRHPMFAMTIPSKLFMAFAAGTPILAGLDGEAAALATDSGGSYPFDASQAESLADAVKALLAAPAAERHRARERLRGFYQQHFVKRELLEEYFAALQDAAGVPGVARARKPGVE